jgi:hypothetical protein
MEVRVSKPPGKVCRTDMRLHAEQKFDYGHHTPWLGRVKLAKHEKARICEDSYVINYG